MVAGADTTHRIVAAFDLSFDGGGLSNLEATEVTPPEFAGTAVSLQSSSGKITETVAMQGGYTPIKELKVKVPVSSDTNSAYMRLHDWLEKCRPKARGGGGDFQKYSGAFTTYNWKGDVVEEYKFTDAWPYKFELEEVKADEEKDIIYGTFTCYLEKYERTPDK